MLAGQWQRAMTEEKLGVKSVAVFPSECMEQLKQCAKLKLREELSTSWELQMGRFGMATKRQSLGK